MKIAVIGSTMMDVVLYVDKIPEAGETRESQDFHIAGGGKGANQAIAAAKLGANVLFVTAVGDDLFGRACRKNYEKCGIDTRYVMTAKDMPNGVASIFVEASGQNRIVITKGANNALTPECLKDAEAAIALCGLIVLQLEIPLETIYAAIKIGRAHGIPVLLNPAPAVHNLDIAMACQCDFFVPNETELSILTDCPVGTEEELCRAANTLIEKGLKNVIVTMGAQGSLWLSTAGVQKVAARHVKAVDSTGAGDSYIGCFAETWSRTNNILESMQRASLYAAMSVTRPGTQNSYADQEEFARYLVQNSK